MHNVNDRVRSVDGKVEDSRDDVRDVSKKRFIVYPQLHRLHARNNPDTRILHATSAIQ